MIFWIHYFEKENSAKSKIEIHVLHIYWTEQNTLHCIWRWQNKTTNVSTPYA